MTSGASAGARIADTARQARDAAQSGVDAAIELLAAARAVQADAAVILQCVRALRVAQQRHAEALAEVDAARRALPGAGSDVAKF